MNEQYEALKKLLMNKSFTMNVIKIHSPGVTDAMFIDMNTKQETTIPMAAIKEAQAEFVVKVIDAFLGCCEKTKDPRFALNIMQVFDIEMAIVISALLRYHANDGLDPMKNVKELMEFVFETYQECIAYRISEGHAVMYHDDTDNPNKTVN